MDKNNASAKNKLIVRNIKLNHEIFTRRISGQVFHTLNSWREKFQLSKDYEIDVIEKGTFEPKIQRKADEYGEALLKKVVSNNDIVFMTWLTTFCKRFKLSRSWEKSILNWIACGYYCPPLTQNITEIEIDKVRNEVVIRLNKDVSRNELIRCFPLIEEQLLIIRDGKKPERIRGARSFVKNLKNFFSSIETRIEALDSDRRILTDKEAVGGLNLVEDPEEDLKKLDEKDKKEAKKIKVFRNRLKKQGNIK